MSIFKWTNLVNNVHYVQKNNPRPNYFIHEFSWQSSDSVKENQPDLNGQDNQESYSRKEYW